MKKIKVQILGHPLTDCFGYSHFILAVLKKYYEVEISDKPDYVFFHDSTFQHYSYDTCIKIFYTGENISPNFNTCDYAISFDYLTFEDRHYRLPIYLVSTFYNLEEVTLAGKEYLTHSKKLTEEDLAKKTEFCSFVYSNYRAEKERRLMFETLSRYKKVNAAGAYLNNMNNKKIINKLAFEMQHKFSVAFENSSRSGYTTEKITSALAAKTIPIYWGNPNIGKEFNTKRFINCHEYSTFEDVLERVKELDSNDKLYLEMVNQPIAAENFNFSKVTSGLDLFLKHIIDQPIEDARRRTINPVKARELLRNDKHTAIFVSVQSVFLKILSTIYKPFKKISSLEKLKQSFFAIKKTRRGTN
jgi:hypothetical protein